MADILRSGIASEELLRFLSNFFYGAADSLGFGNSGINSSMMWWWIALIRNTNSLILALISTFNRFT